MSTQTPQTPTPELVTREMLDAAIARVHSEIARVREEMAKGNATLTWRLIAALGVAVAILKFTP